MSLTGQAAAEVMRHLVEHDAHGYTQSSGRIGNSIWESIDFMGINIPFRGGDRDCSAGVISAWQAVGSVVGHDLTGYASFTGDMVSGLTSTGLWEKKPMSFIADPGDLYLSYTKGHVGMCYSQTPDLIMEFLINENGKIVGGKEGDQTGRESVIQAYRDFPWDCIMHYKGPDYMADKIEEGDMPSAEEIAVAVWNCKLDTDGQWDPAGSYVKFMNANIKDIKAEIMRTDDPSGRGVEMRDHDHIKHIAAKVSAMEEKMDTILDLLEQQAR